jgi:hypothetical protein
MRAGILSRASAATLLVAGMSLLFLPDVVLPIVSSGYPASAAWLGQLLGGAWLGIAALNWLSRSAVLGGIYGRPVVFANAMMYFIGGISILKAAQRSGFPVVLSLIALAMLLFASVYGWLMRRGPFAADLQDRVN